jgi:hypothetical protein
MAKSKRKTIKKPPAEREPDPWFNPYRSPASQRASHALGQIVYDSEMINRKRQ